MNKAIDSENGGLDRADRCHGNACLNCGTILRGSHCHECGQAAHLHRTLGGFAHDLLHGVMHFEGKLWRTLPALLWRPGRMMREYIDGKRARYISPVALFLLTVFISYAIFNAYGGVGDVSPDIDPATEQQMRASISEADEEIATLKQDLDDPRLPAAERSSLVQELKGVQTERDLLIALVDSDDAVDAVDAEIAIEPDATSTLEERLKKAVTKAKDNPGLALYKLQTSSYKYGWLLIPLSLPIMWLLFPFSRRFRMYDHLVVVTYSISVMTMLVVMFSFAVASRWEVLTIVPLFYGMFHLYRTLRGAYELSRLNAAIRTMILLCLINIPIALFVTAILGIALI